MTPQREPTNNGRQPDSNNLWKAIQRSAIDDDHISDAELIDYSAGVLDDDSTRRLLLHLKRCSDCQSEVAIMQAKARDWARNGPSAALRERLRLQYCDSPQEEAWWKQLLNAAWTSLEPVRQRQGAYASGLDIAAVDFPVYDGTDVTSDLHGSLQRRNNEYYIRVSADAECVKFAGRQVEIVLADPETGIVMLQRKVPLDQISLLGTDMQITTEQVTARLIP